MRGEGVAGGALGTSHAESPKTISPIKAYRIAFSCLVLSIYDIASRGTSVTWRTRPFSYLPHMMKETEVLYNAACPVCSFEIDHYRSYADKRALALRFDDLNSCDLARWNLSADEAARRLYVRQGDQLLSGIPAFQVLWEEMPRYRWLARLTRLPGVFWMSCKVYDHILAPLIYNWHRRRVARNTVEVLNK